MHRSLAAGCALAFVACVEAAWAGDGAVLILPLADALALVDRPVPRPAMTASAGQASPWRGVAPGAPPPPPAFIPNRIHIPNLYHVDLERDPPRFAEPVDNDRMVALEFLSPHDGWPGAKFTYDTESLPIGDSSDRVSVRFELPF